VLENPRSPRVRAVAKLTKRSARTETGLFLSEGPQAVREALTYSPEAIVELFATPTGWDKHPDIRAKASDAGVTVEFVTEYVLNAMADTVTPQGLVAVVRQTPTSVRDIFDASPRLVAICEEIRDPGNLGTIIRAAAAAGADAVVLELPLVLPAAALLTVALDAPFEAAAALFAPGGVAPCAAAGPTGAAGAATIFTASGDDTFSACPICKRDDGFR